MKALINKDLCIGCGLCEQSCPEVFEMAADGLAVIRVDSVPPGQEDACREAAANCPVDAIAVKE
jgi:ferredoxin